MILFILIGGGGEYRIAGAMVRLRSVGNPLLASRRWSPRVTSAAEAPLSRRGSMAARRNRPANDAWAVGRNVAAVAAAGVSGMALDPRRRAIALGLKLTFAWTSPGFYRGDDVEVQEMTIGALTHADWPIWNVRSAVFPMSVVYPPQRLARAAGVTSTQTTVFVGRASSLCSRPWRSCWSGEPAALFPGEAGFAWLAVLLFASNKLHVSFGSSELPRPVATVLIVAAFLVLLRAGRWRPPVRVGPCSVWLRRLRFGEAGFVGAACIQLALERRWAHTARVPSQAFSPPALSWASRMHLLGPAVRRA